MTSVEDAGESRRFALFLRITTASTVLFIVGDGAAAVLLRRLDLALLAGVLLTYLGTVFAARALLRAGRLARAVLVVCAGILWADVGTVLVVPWLYPTLCLIPVVVIAIALPHVGGRTLTRLAYASLAATLAVVSAGAVLSHRTPDGSWIFPIHNIFSVAAVSATVTVLLAQYSGRAKDALSRSRRAQEELQAAETDLARRNEELGVTLAGIVDCVISTDAAGRVAVLNEAAERLVARTQAQAYGRPFAELIGALRAEGGEPVSDPVAEVLATGREVASFAPVAWTNAVGDAVSIEYRCAPLRGPAGTPVGTVLVARDVTERLRGEALARSNTDLERFAFVASHDLQEPLRQVISYTQLLEQRYAAVLDDDARQYVAYAVDGATRMRQLINDLLEYSRVDSGARHPGEVDSGAALQGALRSLATLAEETGAEITAGEMPRVRGDAAQVERLFQNLVGNALKYRSSLPPRIRIEAVASPGVWTFSVADNGIGIPERFHEQVFGIFQRLHGAGTYPGTGIGLAICRRIVERSGGRIWVESEPGGGSAFYFSLPSAPAAAPPSA